MTPPQVTESLAEFVVGTDETATTKQARTIAARAFADTLGCALAGTQHPVGLRIGRTARELTPSAPKGAYPFDGLGRLPIGETVLVNATLGHAIDFDDTNHPMYGHPSCHLVPTVMALGELRDLPGRDLVTAYLIGHEIDVALARALNMNHYRQGFHATGTLGTFGAAAAAAKLLGLDVPATRNALGVAASTSSGLRANVGTMTKPLHAGMAAMHGVMAAMLAAQGWEAAPDAIEQPRLGYAASHMVGGTPRYDEALAPLGSAWAIETPIGQQVKPFPACGATHPSIEASATLHGQLAGRLDDIAEVSVGVPPLLIEILVYDDPTDANQARFSLPYTVAAALRRGWLGPVDFTPERVFDPDVRALMRKVTYQADDAVADSTEFAAIVRLTLADGTELSERVDLALGKNGRPMTEEQLRDKFARCVRDDSADSLALWQTWRDVDGDVPARDLVAALENWWAGERAGAAAR
ncbi:MAG TPA: MmgE/PrpD family protein [Pseudonocardiaceae bacterium]|nr:MmgE/PrpD family protein [Pseudonocardiaceae bacterium]